MNQIVVHRSELDDETFREFSDKALQVGAKAVTTWKERRYSVLHQNLIAGEWVFTLEAVERRRE